MKFIRNLSIRNKLLLVSLIPLAALLYFLATDVVDKITKERNIQRVHKDVLEIEKVSDVIHNLMAERGYSIAYVGSGGQSEKSEMLVQRAETDKSIAAFKQLLIEQKKNSEIPPLAVLPDVRSGINQLTISVDTLARRYAIMNVLLLDDANITYRSVRDPEIRNLIESHLFLVNAKGYLGQLRMHLHLALLNKELKQREYAEFARLRGKFENNIDRYYKNTGPSQLASFNALLATPAVALTKKLIDSVFKNPDVATYLPIDTWRLNVTEYLNGLKKQESQSIFEIRQLVEEKQAAIARALTVSIVIVVVVVALILVLLYFVIRAIVDPIRAMQKAADRIALGETDLNVLVASKDEIGQLAASFNKLIAASREYTLVADTISGGDYTSDVTIRSEADLLGKSLANMKHNLRKLSEENATRTWMLMGASELNDILRGEKTIQDLGQQIIGMLTPYLKAQVGAIYLAENNNLELVSSYAFSYRKGNTNHIKIGEGLVGQAAMEKKHIIFANVPDDYIKINSGLGQVLPKNILVYPFMYDSHVSGVIEIGSVHEISDLDIQLLKIVSESIGIAFNSAQSRSKLKELLEETQRQGEELVSQQEELRQTNEELSEKTGMLERSQTELREQQEELQQTNEELEEKANLLEEQKEKLELAKFEVESKAKELEATSKYKSEFLANMSHELRTPLNSILILSQLLTENKNKSLSQKDIEFATNIHNSGSDLLNLINEILDLSKVEAGRIDIEIEPVQVGEVTHSLKQMFTEVARSKNINFEIDCHDERFQAPIYTDRQRLEQILRNLLSNAFKFTDRDGKVTVTMDVKAPDVSIRNEKLRSLPQMAMFSVSDSGIGIPADKQGIIFEAFQQADGSTKRKFGGTGLGLSISRELAGALGGEIHLQSEEGKGSTFSLYLPLQFNEEGVTTKGERIVEVIKPEKKQADPEIPAHVPTPHKEAKDDRYHIHANDKTILIIEDDEPFATVLLEIAREKGYKGIMAHQGNTGLSLARYYRPDAIILDMKLPVLDGSEVLRLLKNDPELRHIPVQIMSGYDRRKEGLELGAFDFIRKPLTQEAVKGAFDRIEDFMSRKLKKLLVVEDNKQQNQAIRELIGNGDIKSFSAFTGQEAYNMLQEEKFDCIIIDLGLPDMSGFELMEKIKESEELNRIPIIVYTGRDMNKDEARQLEKLANTVVLKTSNSKERLLDETALFLHRVEAKLPKEKQQIIRKLHRTEEVLKSRKVLIVDDDMRNIYSLTNVLEEEGMKCYVAENGKVALDMLNKHADIDIVLMDVMMPEMDGYEATMCIRKMEKYNKLPIIALTAKAMKGDREKCLEAGMSDYVSKPVNIEQLLSLMRVWLYQ
ncbi:response regulator [Niastella sp. OAS944]|uniref:response regulator n=1 Tax=Niastella sp. OAS944 TaxID=2664089 RepID=UPI0035C7D73E|nr:CheY-like chemotaxis protein/HAMP domain-containing protein/putative methionine-R-sulfoxide reductase with GAF domain [Chitinophagaceae bacterium OAS944]